MSDRIRVDIVGHPNQTIEQLFQHAPSGCSPLIVVLSECDVQNLEHFGVGNAPVIRGDVPTGDVIYLANLLGTDWGLSVAKVNTSPTQPQKQQKPKSERKPLMILLRDPNHGNEYRIGVDPRGTGMTVDDLESHAWYYDEEGFFITPGREFTFITDAKEQSWDILAPQSFVELLHPLPSTANRDAFEVDALTVGE